MTDTARRAILSVTDKTNLVDFGKSLRDRGFALLGSGGTAKALRDAGLEVTEISDVTGQPEILGGRVKTLHPAIHAGILAPSVEDLEGTSFDAVDLVVVNLYDFEGTMARTDDDAQRVENIDIGGPSLLRGAAKNFGRVTVLCDPSQYDIYLKEFDANDGQPSLEFRRACAGQVFATCARYDGLISRGLFEGAHTLRYGENPHQAATWSVDGGGGLEELGLDLNGGKELSYNNILDVVGALKLSLDLADDACAIIKHTNPCGVGRGGSVRDSIENALKGDPVSAFGGIVALARPVDEEAAELLAKRFLEVVLAPGYTDAARKILKGKKNLRWLDVDRSRFEAATRGNVRQWGRLVLSQGEDQGFPELEGWKLAAGPEPTDEQFAAGELAWRVSKHVKSNAIVLAGRQGTLGIGAGQMSRVDSSRIAIEKARLAELDLNGCSAASDGFFPFPDGVETLAAAGVGCILQPGGSIRDDEVAAAAERLGVSLILTGTRHFRH